MLIFLSILVLSVSIFFSSWIISKSIKNKNPIVINYYNQNLHSIYDNGDYDEYNDYDEYDDEEEYDEEDNRNLDMFSIPDDDTMIFIFENINAILDFMKSNNLVIDNSKIGEYNGMYFIDLSYLPNSKQKNIRILANEWLGQEIRDIKIANYLKDWLYTN